MSANPKNLRYVRAVGAILAVLVLATFCLMNSPFRFFVKELWVRHAIQDEATAKAVLAEARSLMASHPLPDGERVRRIEPTEYPPSIAKLHPRQVYVFSDGLHIEFGSGFWHCGFDCYPEGVVGSGGMKIRDGLWFVSPD